jgi:hypothetical protein
MKSAGHLILQARCRDGNWVLDFVCGPGWSLVNMLRDLSDTSQSLPFMRQLPEGSAAALFLSSWSIDQAAIWTCLVICPLLSQ